MIGGVGGDWRSGDDRRGGGDWRSGGDRRGVGYTRGWGRLEGVEEIGGGWFIWKGHPYPLTISPSPWSNSLSINSQQKKHFEG